MEDATAQGIELAVRVEEVEVENQGIYSCQRKQMLLKFSPSICKLPLKFSFLPVC